VGRNRRGDKETFLYCSLSIHLRSPKPKRARLRGGGGKNAGGGRVFTWEKTGSQGGRKKEGPDSAGGFSFLKDWGGRGIKGMMEKRGQKRGGVRGTWKRGPAQTPEKS